MTFLHNLNVLITRPIHQSQPLVEAISKLGGNPIVFPTIEIQDSEQQLKHHEIQKLLNQADKIIFVSANACYKFAKLSLNPPPKLYVLAIGGATKRVLNQIGITVDYFVEHQSNSETLLECELLQKVANNKIIIFAGEEGRDLLFNTLSARGADVRKIPLYKRVCPVTTREQLFFISNANTNPTIITCTSVEILKNLSDILASFEQTAWLAKQFLLVISPRIASYAKLIGSPDENIVISPASTEAMIETLQAWYAKFIASNCSAQD